MPNADDAGREARYLDIVLAPIRVCRNYKPKFGSGKENGLTLAEFQTLYGADAFYNWLGLSSPLMYSAHKAAGGMTSVYRQIGIGCQRLFSQILIDELGLTVADAAWSYEVQKTGSTKMRKLALDARIPIAAIRARDKQNRVKAWMQQCATALNVDPEVAGVQHGAVFEVRQGYKSMDSKRQNADITSAATAYASGYLPVVLVLSEQINSTLVTRYSAEKYVVLRGTTGGKPVASTYAFCRDVIGYDLAGFFQRNSATLKQETEQVLRALLSP